VIKRSERRVTNLVAVVPFCDFVVALLSGEIDSDQSLGPNPVQKRKKEKNDGFERRVMALSSSGLQAGGV